MTKIMKATLALDALICGGWEWPDATARVGSQFGVNMEKLTASYDDAVNTGWMHYADMIKAEEG